MQHIKNQVLNLPIVSTNVVSGVISDLRFIKDGTVQSPTYTVSVINAPANLYNLIFTPTSVGKWAVFLEGKVQFYIDVVDRGLFDILSVLENEALGSWRWDKTTGVLTLYKIDGSDLQAYNIVETDLESSRELRV